MSATWIQTHTPAEAIIRAMTPVARLHQMAAMNLGLDALIAARLRLQAPYASAAQRGVWRALQRLGQPRTAALIPSGSWEQRMTDEPTSPLTVAGAAARCCDALAIPYLIGGGVAATVHGEFRATRDIDLIIRLAPAQRDQLAAALQNDFIVQPAVITLALQALYTPLADGMPRRRYGSFSAYHQRSGYQLDVYCIGDTPYERAYLERALVLDVPEAGGSLRLSSAEDSVLTKLEWYGITPSERQWTDLQGILRIQGPALDRTYINRWASELGIADLWHALEAGQAPPNNG